MFGRTGVEVQGGEVTLECGDVGSGLWQGGSGRADADRRLGMSLRALLGRKPASGG